MTVIQPVLTIYQEKCLAGEFDLFGVISRAQPHTSLHVTVS